ncbi:MAG TPA: hypothetical protein VNJ04_02820 [Gemmatimonadaceae bacterium]|nr:hypothetical protein [Gemmatimonadaceae bacterium]
MSRVAEVFGCLPSEAVREIERQPVGYLEDMLLLRSYAEIKGAMDAGRSEEDLGGGALVLLCGDITTDLAKEALRKRQRDAQE